MRYLVPSVCGVSDALYLQVTKQKTRPSSGQALQCSGDWSGPAHKTPVWPLVGASCSTLMTDRIILLVNIRKSPLGALAVTLPSALTKCPEPLSSVLPSSQGGFSRTLQSLISQFDYNSINPNFSAANNIPAELD